MKLFNIDIKKEYILFFFLFLAVTIVPTVIALTGSSSDPQNNTG